MHPHDLVSFEIHAWEYAGATQARTFLRCASKWWFEYIARIVKDATESMKRGTRVHWLLERWLATGAVPEAGLKFRDERNDEEHETTDLDVEIALALVPRLPDPVIPSGLVECGFDSVTLTPPIRFKGTIDLVEPALVKLDDGRDALVVSDHKTRSALKWALSPPELRNDIQAIAYSSHVVQASGWEGPVVFRHYNVTTSKPHRVEIVDCIFEPADLERGRAQLARTVQSMALAATVREPSRLAYNLDACSDYASRVNPDGCAHRHRCAALGRRTLGAFSDIANPDARKVLLMTDVLADILAAGSAPAAPNPLDAAAASGAVDPARAKLIEQIRAIDPDVAFADDADLAKVFETVTAEQTKAISMLMTLKPGTYSAGGSELRAVSLPSLRKLIADAQPPAIESMPDDAIKTEIMRRKPEVKPEHFEGRDRAALIAVLAALRPESAVDAGQINPPDAAPKTVDPAVAETVAGAQPKPPAKRTTRGARMPDAYGGELITRTSLDSGELRRYLREHGYPVPVGKGYGKRLKKLAAQVVAGVIETPSEVDDDLGPFEAGTVATPIGAQTPAAAPVSASTSAGEVVPLHSERDAAASRVRGLARELGLPVPTDEQLAASTDEALVAAVAQLEVRLAEARAAGAGETPAEPTPAPVPEPTTPSPAPQPPTTGFVLFVDCRPSDHAIDLLAHPQIASYARVIAEAKSVPHYLALAYNEGSKRLAAMIATQIAEGALALVGNVCVSTSTPSGPSVVEALSPLARLIVKGDR